MGNNDMALIKEHQRLNGIITQIEIRLNNLKKTEGQISPERYSSQEKEYTDLLEDYRPKYSELERQRLSKLETYINELENIKIKLDPINSEIEQEKKLLKIGAISKKNFKITIKPLEDKMKTLQSEINSKKQQIKLLQGTKTTVFKPHIGGVGFGSNFWTGTKILLLIAVVLIIGIPTFFFALGVGKLLVMPLVVIGVFIILIALLGRGIEYVKNRW